MRSSTCAEPRGQAGKGIKGGGPLQWPKMEEDVGVCIVRLDSQVGLRGRVTFSPVYLAVPGTWLCDELGSWTLPASCPTAFARAVSPRCDKDPAITFPLSQRREPRLLQGKELAIEVSGFKSRVCGLYWHLCSQPPPLFVGSSCGADTISDRLQWPNFNVSNKNIYSECKHKV